MSRQVKYKKYIKLKLSRFQVSQKSVLTSFHSPPSSSLPSSSPLHHLLCMAPEGVTDVLMWPRFLITAQLKAPFASVRHDGWGAEAKRGEDAMLTNKKSRGDGDGGRRVRGDDGAEGGSVSHGEDDTHLWKCWMRPFSVFHVLGVMSKWVITGGEC